MKRLISLLLTLVICAGLTDGALAEDHSTPFFQLTHWAPEDVDISGVREVDGRLVGTVKLPATDWRNMPTGELYVDCPLPADFTPEQHVTLYIQHKKISKRQLLEGMEAVLGEMPAVGETSAFNNGRQTHVQYVSEPDIDSGYYWQQYCDAALSADAAYKTEYELAKDLTRRLAERFGATLNESTLHANRRDAAHTDPASATSSSFAAEISAQAREAFNRREAKLGRATCRHTMVSGLFELRGLPVADQYYWMEGRDWISACSGIQTAIRDGGVFDYVLLESLPEIVRAEPLELPAFDWRALLRQAVIKLVASNATREDVVLNGDEYYASYAVITDLKPCWVGKASDTLVPGWYCVTEERVSKDGSVVYPWALYGDYEGLMEK